MSFPLVSRERFDEMVKRCAALEAELEKERAASRSMMATALASRGISDPYTKPPSGPVAKPIGKKGAESILRALEMKSRAEAAELAKEANGAAASN